MLEIGPELHKFLDAHAGGVMFGFYLFTASLSLRILVGWYNHS
jgi:hypothetical protein